MNAIFRLTDMTPDLIQRLKDERERLFVQRAAISDQIRALDELIRVRESTSVGLEFGNSSHKASTLSAPDERKRQRNPIAPATVGSYARQILLDEGRPLKRGALLRKFDERNIPVVGGDRAKVLGTTIWRLKDADGHRVFVNTERGYWPADVPIP